MEVLRLFAEGHSLEEIARRLHRSVETVKSHRRRIGRKLGVRNRVELVKIALRMGLVSLRGDSAAVSDYSGLLAAMDHSGVAACLLDGKGGVVIANDRFRRLHPEDEPPQEHPSLARVFEPDGPSSFAELLASAAQSGFAAASVRLARGREAAGVRVCRCSMGAGPARLLLLVEQGQRSGDQQRAGDGAENQAAMLKLVTDSTLFSSESGAFAVLLWRVASLLNASHVVLFERPDRPGAPMQTVASWGREGGLDRASSPLELCCEPLLSGSPVHVQDGLAELYPGLKDGRFGAGRSMVAAPILAEGEVLGGLAVISDEPRPDPRDAVSVLSLVSGRLASELNRTRSERRREEQERRFRRLVEILPDGFFHGTAAGELSGCNAAMTAILGLSYDLCIGRGWMRCIHPADREAVQAAISGAALGVPAELDARILRPSGEVRGVRIRLIGDAEHRAAPGVLGTLSLSDRVPLDLTSDANPLSPLLGALTVSPDGTVLAADHTGALASVRTLSDLVAGDERDFVAGMLARVRSDQDRLTAVVRLPESAGPRFARIRLRRASRSPAGEVETMIAVITDETRHWLLQMTAAVSRMGWSQACTEAREGRLREFECFERSPIGAVGTDSRGVFLAANASARRWLGLSVDALGRGNLDAVRTAPGFPSARDLFAQQAATRGGSGVVHLCPDGAALPVRFFASSTPCGLHVGILTPA